MTSSFDQCKFYALTDQFGLWSNIEILGQRVESIRSFLL
jgi:hypothetical protein